MTIDTTTEELRAWVGCLACYNAGHLVGRWLEAGDCAEVTSATIHEGVARVTIDDDMAWGADGPHEELWCMDLEGFPAECGEMSPADAARIAAGLEQIDTDTCGNRAAFLAFLANEGTRLLEVDDDTMDRFRDAFQGEWDSEEGFAENLAEELGAVDRDASWPNDCIDWKRAARELFMGDYHSARADGGTVYVFRAF